MGLEKYGIFKWKICRNTDISFEKYQHSCTYMSNCLILSSISHGQYFSPYVSADMNKMAVAFNTTVADLEDELTQLILEGLINARIDSHSKAGLRSLICHPDTSSSGTTFPLPVANLKYLDFFFLINTFLH